MTETRSPQAASRRRTERRLAACGGLLVLAVPAHAYLDPGAGSMLAQLAAAGFAGLAVLLRLYWGRIKARLTGASKPPPSP